MRTRSIQRAGLAAAALSLAIPSAAAIPAAAQNDTKTAGTAHRGTARAALPRTRIAVERRRLHVRAGAHVAVAGRVRPAVNRVAVALQMRVGRHWHTLRRDRTDARGHYRLRLRVGQAQSAGVRVLVVARRGIRAAHRPLGRIEAFRPALASWYGPGLYGNRLGCGGTLSATRLGVAHKSLPCGSKVTLRYRGRSVRVPVIDRGPYVGTREYDLTSATAQRLGFHGTGTILTTR